jgi:hypothetical protein
LFAGTKRMYLLSSDKTGRISDWQEVGAWSDTGDPKAVELISLTPNSGSGGAVTLTSVVKDGDGANTIQFTQFVMNAGLNGYNACFIHYDRASNTFYLLKDDASAWLGLEPGKQVQNSQCVLRAEGSGGTASGNTLTVTYNLLFKGGFTGSRQIYLWTAGNDADIQSWKQMGTWNVSGATLSSAGGSSPTRATRKVAEETGALPGIPSSLSMPTHYRVIRDGMLYRVGETVVETSLPGNADQRR